MKRPFLAIVVALCAALAPSPGFASGGDVDTDAFQQKMVSGATLSELRSRSVRLGTSTLPTDTDTTWVGFTPGHKAAGNYWSIYAGFGKDGYRRTINGQPNKGVWDWEQPVNGDSLQGWWPARLRYFGGAGTFIDRNRPTTAIDQGNSANYRINQGNGRTHGVTGVWHVDAGAMAPGPTPLTTPNWRPLLKSGSAAWMGLRAHGDLTHSDAAQGGTNNYFNEDVLQFGHVLPLSAGGNDKGFPGYGSQMDQMLYRDIDLSSNPTGNLVVRFSYRTVMSTSAITSVGTRTGWYDKDPLGSVSGATNPQLNNFISSDEAGDANAPRDSFMVYVGAGVDGDQWLGSDGVLRSVYDPQRRWFAEVLHTDRNPSSPAANPQPLYYKELLSVAGNNPVDAAVNPDSWVTTSFTIPNAALQLLARNNTIRLVFRAKTNRGNSDDEGTAYSSNRAGAAVVDDVQFRITPNATFTSLGAFDSPAEIDNQPSTPATQAWKSTGKPPAMYFHAHLFADLPYDDICGQKGDAGRQCNMTGVVISMGDHDNDEYSNGALGTAEMDRIDGMFSPVIQLAGPFTGPGGTNAQGLKARGSGPGDVEAFSDYLLVYDMYTGIFNPSQTGQFWGFGAQSYPGNAKASHGGYPAWGYLKIAGILPFNPTVECFTDYEGGYGLGMIDTSNPSGIPDSLRFHLFKFTRCFRLGLTTNCGGYGGAYYDNVSLAILDGEPSPLNVDLWQWYSDAFPANETQGIAGQKALFDTTSAWIKTAVNNAQTTGYSTIPRRNIPGDSVFINARSSTARVDMVFRVLPGPGNYEPIGQGHSGQLRRVPTSPATVTPNDGSWWDVYRRIPGEFATNPGGMTELKAGWNPNFWLSARCDSAELNLYAFQGRGVLGGPYLNAFGIDMMSTYHESDPRYNLLGINHFICFVRCSGCAIGPTYDIICNGTVPVYGPQPGGGVGYLPPGTPSTTKEGTKIIPDGLLTPGAHVEYFFRGQDSEIPNPTLFSMLPDTNLVFPSDGGASLDAHRWQEFSILPDRWKDPQYVHPVFQTNGRGPACLLVVDNNDRRGNERVWVSIADTIGATEPRKFGAHNGWHAPGNISQGEGIGVNDPAYRVAVHGGSPGTTWDMFQVKASESLTTAGTFGSRFADRSPPALVADKASRIGPTAEMLAAYYPLMMILTGDLTHGIFGPFENRGGNECALIKAWLLTGSTEYPNRGIWAIGNGFVEGNTIETGGYGEQQDLLANYFGVGLASPDYNTFANNHAALADLRLLPDWRGKPAGAVQYYGVRNLCLWTNDVLQRAGMGIGLGEIASEYAATGGGAVATAGVFKRWDPTSPWMALADGWDIENLTTRGDANTINRSSYFLEIFSNVWASICGVAGTPVVPLDVPSFDDGGMLDFVTLKNNPVLAGSAAISFGLAQSDRVEIKVYDVGGRLIRSLVDRFFPAGEHEVVWDGRDDGGRRTARGVYFTRVRYLVSPFAAVRKVTVLR